MKLKFTFIFFNKLTPHKKNSVEITFSYTFFSILAKMQLDDRIMFKNKVFNVFNVVYLNVYK